VTARPGNVILGVLLAAAAGLIVAELALGALGHGRVTLADPCVRRAGFEGSGLDGAVQQLALDGLDGAACRLHATREELVLSFAPDVRTKEIRWNRPTIEDALGAGFSRAVDDAKDRGGLVGIAARIVSAIGLAGSRIAGWLLGDR
jgi:hypothetical protein